MVIHSTISTIPNPKDTGLKKTPFPHGAYMLI
jgi:hypothetical protein